jgi:hypothetical protein
MLVDQPTVTGDGLAVEHPAVGQCGPLVRRRMRSLAHIVLVVGRPARTADAPGHKRFADVPGRLVDRVLQPVTVEVGRGHRRRDDHVRARFRDHHARRCRPVGDR